MVLFPSGWVGVVALYKISEWNSLMPAPISTLAGLSLCLELDSPEVWLLLAAWGEGLTKIPPPSFATTPQAGVPALLGFKGPSRQSQLGGRHPHSCTGPALRRRLCLGFKALQSPP